MVSVEEVVDMMVGPLQEVCSRIRDQLSDGDGCESRPGPFILHRNQWSRLVEAWSEVLLQIKERLTRLIKPLVLSLNDPLLRTLKIAEKSFEECIAPDVRGYFTSKTGGGTDTLVWAVPGLDEQKRMDLRLWLSRSLLRDAEEQRIRMDLRQWMAKHALRHILDREVPHRHMDNLRTASLIIKRFLSVDLTGIMEGGFSTEIWSDDVLLDNREASAFFGHSKIDPHISQLLLHRLGEDIGEENPDDPAAASVDRLAVDPAEFQKPESGDLGEGGSGKVKLRKWISEDHHVAVKKGNINPDEIRIQARVRHPNLLPLLCFIRKTGKSSALVMERMHRDLDQLIRDASESSAGPRSSPPFTSRVCVEMMLQIAKGMEYLHSQHIMHRDLKPANILVSGYDSTSSDDPHHLLRVKIADFGVSKENFKTSDPSKTHEVGSGFYRAPEVMDKETNARYSRKADVYSFAMVCYRILSGKDPFDGDSRSPRLLWEGIRKGELRPELDFACEDALKVMVEVCWHHDVSRRPQFAQITKFLRFTKIRIHLGLLLKGGPRIIFRMISIGELVERMVRPLQMVCSRMQAKLSEGDGDKALGRPFILHKQQWNAFAQLYSKVVAEITTKIAMILVPLMEPLDEVEWIPFAISNEEGTRMMIRLLKEMPSQMRARQWNGLAETYSNVVDQIQNGLERILKLLHELRMVMEAAEKSFQECVAPHVRGYAISDSGSSRAVDAGYKYIWKGPKLGDADDQRRTDLRLWMAKDALRHILDCEVRYRHMDNLRTTSMAIHQGLLLVIDAGVHLAREPQAISTHDFSGEVYPKDNGEARAFFSHQEMSEIDIHISQLLLYRLGDGMSDDNGNDVAVEKLVLQDPAQFQMCDGGSGIRTLGMGAFGSVKSRKYWISDDHHVHMAVKKGCIRREEIEIQARVRHPNLLPLLCCTRKTQGHDPNTLLSVMERMDSDLDQLIRDASERLQLEGPRSSPPFTTRVSVEMMLQIAKGMDYLHSHYIIHRGLKPANILISGYDSTSSDDPPYLLRVKVADFGCAKGNFGPFDRSNSFRVGTGFYRAPEVMDVDSTDAGYDMKSDVYSFAMLCYRILSGKEPFHGDSRPLSVPWEGIRKGKLRPEFDFECENALKEMVAACWHHDTARRPDFAQIADFLRYVKICIVGGSSDLRGPLPSLS